MKLRATMTCLALALIAAGCSPAKPAATERNVFEVAAGFSQGGPGVPTEILDIGLPALLNTTGDRVKLTGITLAATTKGVRIRSITAFRYDTQDAALGLGTGNVRHCPGAQPLSVVSAAPHQQSAWFVVIAVTFAGPGRYYIGKARIGYTAGGVKGWQYQNLFTTMRINKLRAGQKLKYSNPCP